MAIGRLAQTPLSRVCANPRLADLKKKAEKSLRHLNADLRKALLVTTPAFGHPSSSEEGNLSQKLRRYRFARRSCDLDSRLRGNDGETRSWADGSGQMTTAPLCGGD